MIGAFNIIVRDPSYPSQAIFDLDMGASCPNSFTVDFIIPTEGNDTFDKTMLVDITDSYRTIKMTVFRPAPNMSREAYGKYRHHMKSQGRSEEKIGGFRFRGRGWQ